MPAITNKKSWAEKAQIKLAKTMHSLFNGDSEKLAKVLTVLAILHIGMFLAVIVFALLQDDRVSKIRDCTFGVVGVMNGLLGMFGAKFSDRGVLMLYFVLLLWGLAVVVSNLATFFHEQTKQTDICNHALEAELSSTGQQSCSTKLLLVTAKLLVACISSVTQAFGCWLALRLSEKIQDELAEAMSEHDSQAQQTFATQQAPARRKNRMFGM